MLLQFHSIYFILAVAVVELFLLWTKKEIFRLPKNILICVLIQRGHLYP